MIEAMSQALADFRIESDYVVRLTFSNGRSYRVNPRDLGHFLGQDDLNRVHRALHVRRQFIRRILPPTALVLVVVGIIGFGRYDMSHISRSWLVPAPASSQQTVPNVTPAPTTSPTSTHQAQPVSLASGAAQSAATPAIASKTVPSTTILPGVTGTASLQHPPSAASANSQPAAVKKIQQPLLNLQPVTSPIEQLPVVKALGL
jgi:hypothetical protein